VKHVDGIVTAVREKEVYVTFSYSQYGRNELSFKYNAIRPFQTRFPGGKFKPLYLSSIPRDTQRRMIRRHEKR